MPATPAQTKTFDDAFSAAKALHKAGKIKDALVGYEEIAGVAPAHAEFFYLLGGARLQCGRTAEAIPALQRTLSLQPDHAAALDLIGTAWLQIGEPAKAIPPLVQAVALVPANLTTRDTLGNALLRCERPAEALETFQHILAQDPQNRRAQGSAATALNALGRTTEAEALAASCVLQHPDYPRGYITHGTILAQLERFFIAEDVFRRGIRVAPGNHELRNLLAACLLKQGRHEEAEAAYQEAIKLAPTDTAALTHLGESMLEQTRFNDAEQCFLKVLRLNPRSPSAMTGLGRVEELRGSLEAGITLHKQALALQPDHEIARINLGNARRFSADLDGALAEYDAALRINPSSAIATANRGMTLLMLGRLGEAWPLYRSRIRAQAGARDMAGDLPWDGSPLTGKRVMVWTEYGLGDEILFAGLIAELLQVVSHCTLVCSPRLATPFRRSFPAATVVPFGESVDGTFDFHLPLTDVAQFLRPSLESFPKHTGYLKADPTLVEKLRGRYKKAGKKVIGLSWRSASGVTGQFKSLSLRAWSWLLKQDATFVSLQYGDVAAEVEAVTAANGVDIIVDKEIDSSGDLDPFIAQVAAMDLVISVSNTTVHVAGALGVPVWILAPTGLGAHWYWFQERIDNPWYPSARVFRQPNRGGWNVPLAAAADELKQWLAG